MHQMTKGNYLACAPRNHFFVLYTLIVITTLQWAYRAQLLKGRNFG